MKILFALSFMVMGGVFLLVGSVFYPSITELLVGLEAGAGEAVPDFWNLALILPIVRVIFLIVGGFLTVLGTAFFWIIKR